MTFDTVIEDFLFENQLETYDTNIKTRGNKILVLNSFMTEVPII